MKKIGSLSPRRSKEICGSGWAVHYSAYAKREKEYSIEKLAQTGVKWVRYYFDSVWSKVEVNKGEYFFDTLDEHIDQFLSQGITPYLQIGGGNFHYTEGLTGYHPMNSDEAKSAFLSYVDHLVAHFKDRIFHWELWNEINLSNFWKPAPDIEQYAQLLCDVSAIIRKHQGDKAKIIAASFAGIPLEEIEQLMQSKAKGHFDILGIHPYHYHPESCNDHMQKAKEIIKKYDPSVEIWNTESGDVSSGDTIHGRQLSAWGHNIQAKWVLRRFMADRVFGLKMSTYFLLSDYNYTRQQYDNKEIQVREDQPIWRYVGTNTKGLLHYHDGSAKKSFKSLQNITALLDDDYQIQETCVKFNITNEGIFYGAGKSERDFLNPAYMSYKSANKGNLFVYWLPWIMQEIIEPGTVDITISDLSFEDPILIDLLTGDIYDITCEVKDNSTLVRNLCLTDYPIAIAERKAVQFL